VDQPKVFVITVKPFLTNDLSTLIKNYEIKKKLFASTFLMTKLNGKDGKIEINIKKPIKK
jgi:hypothetical protein